MRTIAAILSDRRRRQSGSVLSAVLILTACLAIISGALATAVSTNFLLSNDLVNRVKTEATVNSAAELAISLQGTPLNAPCPSLTPAQISLNGQSAVVNYVSCAPVPYWREQQFVPVATSSQFTLDGTIAQVFGRNEYVVADAGGSVFDFTYGSASPRWTLGLGGNVTAPPLVMPDGSSNISTLVPVSGPNNNPGVTPDCGPADDCVALLSEDLSGGSTALQCFLDAGAPVTAQPAAGKAFPSLAYFGDANGTLFAYQATENGNCSLSQSVRVAGGQAVVAGPIVWQNGSSDEIFIVTSGSGSSQFLHYTYSQGSRGPRLTLSDQISLPAASPVGLALEQAGVPTRLALTYASGAVSILQVDTRFDPTVVRTAGVGNGFRDAPYWCTQCPGGSVIGVGGTNGTLYVLGPTLNLVASYAGGSPIRTTPTADLAGDWYFAADDGRLYEVQLPSSGTAMVLAASFGSAGGRIRSSPVLASCPAGICAYLGSEDANAYLISLDARDLVMKACINSCQGIGPNPRLWTHVQVVMHGKSKGVHIQGWSYYSP